LLRLVPPLLLIPHNLIVVVLALLLLCTDLLPLADVVQPVSQVDNVVGVGGVLAGEFELLEVLQFQQLVVVLLRQILDVYVGHPCDEILPIVVQESLLFEGFPIKFVFRLVIEDGVESDEYVLEDGLFVVGEFSQFFWLYFGD